MPDESEKHIALATTETIPGWQDRQIARSWLIWAERQSSIDEVVASLAQTARHNGYDAHNRFQPGEAEVDEGLEPMDDQPHSQQEHAEVLCELHEVESLLESRLMDRA